MASKSIQKTGVYQRWRKKKAMPKIYNSTATGLRNISISKLLRTSQCVCSATSTPLLQRITTCRGTFKQNTPAVMTFIQQVWKLVRGKSKLWYETRRKYSPRITILTRFLICLPVTRAVSSTTLGRLVTSFQLQSVVSNVHTLWE